jgi:hypothetical protein
MAGWSEYGNESRVSKTEINLLIIYQLRDDQPLKN